MRAHAWISHKLNDQQNHVQIQSTEITVLSVLETDSLGKQHACLVGTIFPGLQPDLLEDGDQDARASDVIDDNPGDQGTFGDLHDTHNRLRHGGRPHHKLFSLLSCIFLCTFILNDFDSTL